MRILLADDHGIVREGLRWMLEGEPDVEIMGDVGDGQELLAVLDDHRNDVDIVLLDISMPGLGGFEILARLRDRRSRPAVIVLSMHDHPGYVLHAVELGAVGYLLKSATRQELITALRQVAAGNCYIHSEVTGPLLDKVAGRIPAAPTATLTVRETDVLRLVARGLANKQIGASLGISEATVKAHLKEIFIRLHAANRAESVMKGLELGLLDRSDEVLPVSERGAGGGQRS